MDETETLTRLGLALAIGFLIGVERGWREREEKEGERAAGLRTFALIGLFGGVWGLLTQEIGPAPMGLAFLALAGAVTLFRWREVRARGHLRHDHAGRRLPHLLARGACGARRHGRRGGGRGGDRGAARRQGVAPRLAPGAHLAGAPRGADPAGHELRRAAGAAGQGIRALRGAQPVSALADDHRHRRRLLHRLRRHQDRRRALRRADRRHRRRARLLDRGHPRLRPADAGGAGICGGPISPAPLPPRR